MPSEIPPKQKKYLSEGEYFSHSLTREFLPVFTSFALFFFCSDVRVTLIKFSTLRNLDFFTLRDQCQIPVQTCTVRDLGQNLLKS